MVHDQGREEWENVVAYPAVEMAFRQNNKVKREYMRASVARVALYARTKTTMVFWLENMSPKRTFSPLLLNTVMSVATSSALASIAGALWPADMMVGTKRVRGIAKGNWGRELLWT